MPSCGSSGPRPVSSIRPATVSFARLRVASLRAPLEGARLALTRLGFTWPSSPPATSSGGSARRSTRIWPRRPPRTSAPASERIPARRGPVPAGPSPRITPETDPHADHRPDPSVLAGPAPGPPPPARRGGRARSRGRPPPGIPHLGSAAHPGAEPGRRLGAAPGGVPRRAGRQSPGDAPRSPEIEPGPSPGADGR
jgi:hypothetical protein